MVFAALWNQQLVRIQRRARFDSNPGFPEADYTGVTGTISAVPSRTPIDSCAPWKSADVGALRRNNTETQILC